MFNSIFKTPSFFSTKFIFPTQKHPPLNQTTNLSKSIFSRHDTSPAQALQSLINGKNPKNSHTFSLANLWSRLTHLFFKKTKAPQQIISDPNQVSDALLSYTLEHNISKHWLLDFIERGTGFGKTSELDCVFHSKRMNKILNQPEKYKSITDFSHEMSRHQNELISCLTLGQKLKYGPRFQRFQSDLEAQSAFFDGFALLLSQHAQITRGESVVALASFFFRADRLDEAMEETFDLFVEKLKVAVNARR